MLKNNVTTHFACCVSLDAKRPQNQDLDWKPSLQRTVAALIKPLLRTQMTQCFNIRKKV